MTVAETHAQASSNWRRFDPLGGLIGIVFGAGLLLPFVDVKANRIVPGEGFLIWQSLAPAAAAILLLLSAGANALAVCKATAHLKLGASASALVALIVSVGLASAHMVPADNDYARVSVGAGFWLMALAFALMVTDALSRLKLRPLVRIGLLVLSLTLLGGMLWSGLWDEVSIVMEYASRAPAFWQEARTHVLLAFASVAMAIVIGVPIGIACYKLTSLRASALNVLNIIQTIPSIALFGVLIAPLGWIAANLPGASAIGISGIGVAPAMVALVAYALLPIVANTLVGLTSLPGATAEAARGSGMNWQQRLLQVELPLALPVILTGVRIVLVQNIGLATIAALIGGGGFGVFVFQGIGQTAIDLVLLGAVPTVALAFATAVVFDSLIEMASGRSKT